MKMQSFKIRLFEAIMIFLLSLIFSMNSAFGDVILTTVSDNKVIKLDSSGNVIWAKDIGYPVLTATEDPIDGSVYVGTGDWIDRIIKLDPNGQILWNEVYSFSPIPLYRVYSIVVDQDDGNIYASSSCYYGKLLKIDPLGNLIWVRGRGHIPYDTFPNDLPQISIDPTDGNIYGISYWNTFDVWGTLYKFDTNGNHIWTKPVEVGYGCNTGTVAVNPKDRNVYVGGRLSVYNLDSNGNIIWETPIAVETRGLAVDSSDGSVYVGGYASPSFLVMNHDIRQLNVNKGNYANDLLCPKNNKSKIR